MRYLFLILLFFSFHASSQSVWWFVNSEGNAPPENEGDYYVSNSGNDSWDGTAPAYVSGTTGPKATVAGIVALSPGAGDTVLFERGDYWEETLTIPNSGSSGSPVVYGAYGTGSAPKIYGSNLIDISWTVHSGNIYVGDYSTTITQLFLNDERVNVSREPDSGWGIITSVQNSTTQFTSTDLESSYDYTDALCVLWSSNFLMYNRDVTGQSGTDSIKITTSAFSSGNYNNLKIDCGFVLVGGLDLIDQAGEWWYDDANNKIYVWTPDGTSPANYTVRGSVRDNGVVANNKDYWTIENLEILQQQETGITMSGTCNYYTIKNSSIHDMELQAIYDNDNSDYNEFDNLEIYNISIFGVQLRVDYSDFTNCNIYDISLLENVGLEGFGSNYGTRIVGNYNTISYNTLNRCGGMGLYFGRSNNLVEYNYVDSTCLEMNDVGGIYISDVSNYGTAPCTIRYNIVTDARLLSLEGCVSPLDGLQEEKLYTEGIYLDDGADGVIVYGNTVTGSGNGGVKVHGVLGVTVNNDVNNNVFYKNGTGVVTQNNNSRVNYFEENIVYAGDLRFDYETNPLNSIYQGVVESSNASGYTMDDNFYYAKYHGSAHLFRYKPSEDTLTWTGWLANTTYDDNTSFDGTSLGTDTDTIFYNTETTAQEVDLSGYVYEDLDGDPVTSLTLQPFTSQILIVTGSAPSAPVATDYTDQDTTSFTANWNASSGATGYDLDVSESNTFSSYVSGYEDLDVGNVTSKSVTGLDDLTTYYYRVRAYNTNGTSGNSNTITAYTDVPQPLALSATSIGETSFVANWTDESYYSSYRIYVSEDSDFSTHVTGWNGTYVGTGSSYTINTGLSAGTTYYYRLDAYYTDAARYTSEGNTITVTTTGGEPAYVSTATAVNSSTNSLACNVPSGGASGDAILYFVNANGSSNTITDSSGDFTKIAEYSGSTTMTTAVFYKEDDGSEPASYTFTTSSTDRLRVTSVRIENVDMTDLIDAYDNDNSASGTSITAPSVSNSTSGNYMICTIFVDSSTNYPTDYDSGMDERVNPGSAVNNISIYDEILSSTGATGTRSFTVDFSGGVVSWSIILNKE
jgi:hypothetical protein